MLLAMVASCDRATLLPNVFLYRMSIQILLPLVGMPPFSKWLNHEYRVCTNLGSLGVIVCSTWGWIV